MEQLFSYQDDLMLVLLIWIIVGCMCDFIRLILELTGLQDQMSSDIQRVVFEFIGTVESLVVLTELIQIIWNIYGMAVFIFTIFLFCTWRRAQGYKTMYQYHANPLGLLANYLQDVNPYNDFVFLLMMFSAQCLGAYASYHVSVNLAWKYSNTLAFWSDRSTYHTARHTQSWTSGIKISPIWAACIEGGFSFISYLLPSYLEYSNVSQDVIPIIVDLGRAILAGVGGLYTGGYLNPILASSHELHSSQPPLIAKVCVYWVGPFTGIIVAILAYHKLG